MLLPSCTSPGLLSLGISHRTDAHCHSPEQTDMVAGNCEPNSGGALCYQMSKNCGHVALYFLPPRCCLVAGNQGSNTALISGPNRMLIRESTTASLFLPSLARALACALWGLSPLSAGRVHVYKLVRSARDQVSMATAVHT